MTETIVNMSFEMTGRRKPAKRVRAVTARIPRKYRGYEAYPLRAFKRGVRDAIIATPEPPCTNHVDGLCPNIERCAAQCLVCPAFTQYVNSRNFRTAKRVPNRHIRCLDLPGGAQRGVAS